MAKTDILLFDLDGTLIDSIGDLYAACRYALLRFGLKARTLEEIRLFVGNGLKTLVCRALPDDKKELLDEVYPVFREYYFSHCCVYTKPYQGIPETLSSLKKAGFKMAIVTNKPCPAAEKIADVFFKGTFDCVCGQRENVKLKPDGQMVFEALQKLNGTPEKAVYIGDSEVDILTAKNAETGIISVSWGFRSRSELLESGACIVVSSPVELKEYILKKEMF